MGSELVESAPLEKPFTKVFEKAFPFYLALGMSYEDFWSKDSCMVIAYREADKIRRTERNYEAWLQGAYVYEAIVAVAPVLIPFAKNPKPSPYLKEPYPLSKEEAEEKREEEGKSDNELAVAKFAEWAKRLKLPKG